MSTSPQTEPMESHGLRLPPPIWRSIESRAKRARTPAGKPMDRSQWLRRQIEALLDRDPEVHEMHSNEQTEPADGTGIDWRNTDD